MFSGIPTYRFSRYLIVSTAQAPANAVKSLIRLFIDYVGGVTMKPISLLNEAKTRKMFLEADKKEIESIEEELRSGNTSRKTRLEELFELIDDHITWLETHAKAMSEAARLLRRAIV